MNDQSTKFPFHQEDDLFHVSSIPYQEHVTQQDLFMGHASLGGSNLTDKMRPRQKILATPNNNFGNMNNDNKKIMHRELEQQRRRQIATLNASLRSLLPNEFVKGKRSAADHMNGAVNYIEHLQKKIKELGVKRDELKKLSTPSSHSCHKESSNLTPNCVIVRPYFGGVEIVIRSGFREEGFPLSRVVETLLEEEFTVVSCGSTKENKRLFHTIQSEVTDLTCVDLPGLQRKLSEIMNPSSR